MSNIKREKNAILCHNWPLNMQTLLKNTINTHFGIEIWIKFYLKDCSWFYMNGSTLSDCSIQVDLDTNCLIQGDHLLQIWLWYHYHDIHVLSKKAIDYEETIKWCKLSHKTDYWTFEIFHSGTGELKFGLLLNPGRSGFFQCPFSL